MHRSGTSLVAQIAHGAGGDFGNADSFWPADTWNPAGYFEQDDIVHLNRKIVNGSIGRAHYFFLPSASRIELRANRLRPDLVSLAKKYDTNIVKENRFCLTLPQWRQSGLRVERLLVVFRNPRDVALSLRRRNKVPSFIAHKLWYEHVSRLENSTKGVPKEYLWYDSFIENERGLMIGLHKLAWLTGVDVHRLRVVADPIVRYSQQSLDRKPDKYFGKIAEMYQSLIEQSLET